MSEVFHGVAFSVDGRAAFPAPTPSASPTARSRRSATPTATSGCSRRSPPDCPGGWDETDVATLADLLLETAKHHDRFEKAAPAHDWWDWYAPYLDARRHGSTSEEATAAADRYMKDVRGVVREG